MVVTDLAISASILSGVASALVMFLIKKKGDWNTHVTLIWWMTAFQFCYDATFVPSAMHGGDRTTYLFGQFCQNTFGLLSSFITNVIAGILYYVIVMRKAFDLDAYWVQVAVLTYAPVLLIQIATIWAIISGPEKNLREVNVIYYWLRVVSIVINFAFCSMAYYAHVGRMTDSNFRTYTDGLLRTIIKRTLWYPIVQAITRLPACYYEFKHGWQPYSGNGSDEMYTEAILWVLFTPSAGVGYLAIYLISAPGSKQNMHKLFFVDIPAIFMCRRGCEALLEPWNRQERQTNEAGLNKVKEFNAQLKRKSDTLVGGGDLSRGTQGSSVTNSNKSSMVSRYNEDVGPRNSRPLSVFSEGTEEESSLDSRSKPSGGTAGDDIPGSQSSFSREGSHAQDGYEKELLRHMENLEEDELFEVMSNLETLDDLQKRERSSTGRAAGGVTVSSPLQPGGEDLGAERERKGTSGTHSSRGHSNGRSTGGSGSGQGVVVTSFSLSSDDDQDYADV